MKRGLKFFCIAIGLVLASAPAFANDHFQINPDLGVVGGFLFLIWQEMLHLWNHVSALLLAASTGDWVAFQMANICADQAVLTKLFFTRGGWISMITLYTLWRYRRAPLRASAREHPQLAMT